MRVSEGDPLHTSLTPIDKFYITIHSVMKRCEKDIALICYLLYNAIVSYIRCGEL